MRIYHGSQYRIERPVFGKGKPHNDYGLGFYCTEDRELAKEWSCLENSNGFANAYDFDIEGLSMLDLNRSYGILHWIAILLRNRVFRLSSRIAKDGRAYLLDHFSIDISGIDVIRGYRADDSYFSFAQDFLNNTISVLKLSEALHLGGPGEQIVLKSEKAFSHLRYLASEEASWEVYYVKRCRRDQAARSAYLKGDHRSDDDGELYLIDIMRQEVHSDDPRLR